MMNYRHTNKLSMLYLWFNKSYNCYHWNSADIPTVLLIFLATIWLKLSLSMKNDRYSTHAEQLNLKDFLYTALPNTSVILIIVYGYIIYPISVEILRIFKIFQFYNAAPRK